MLVTVLLAACSSKDEEEFVLSHIDYVYGNSEEQKTLPDDDIGEIQEIIAKVKWNEEKKDIDMDRVPNVQLNLVMDDSVSTKQQYYIWYEDGGIATLLNEKEEKYGELSESLTIDLKHLLKE